QDRRARRGPGQGPSRRAGPRRRPLQGALRVPLEGPVQPLARPHHRAEAARRDAARRRRAAGPLLLDVRPAVLLDEDHPGRARRHGPEVAGVPGARGRDLPAGVTLAELIDLEAQLGRDYGADPGALQARDRGLLSAAPAEASTSRTDVLRRWLAALRKAEPGRLHPGSTVSNALRAVRAAAVLAGLGLGWGAATALLRYTGQEPVNVWDFLLVFVGLQILLFVLLLCSFFLPVAALGTPLLGLFRWSISAIYPRLAGRGLLGKDPARLAGGKALWHRLRRRRSLYHGGAPGVPLGITQAFGVAFNAGALLGCLRLIVFSDIAFSWSTTLLQLDAGRFHRLVHALAAPFGWIWPDASPSAALVEATRYSRLEGS